MFLTHVIVSIYEMNTSLNKCLLISLASSLINSEFYLFCSHTTYYKLAPFAQVSSLSMCCFLYTYFLPDRLTFFPFQTQLKFHLPPHKVSQSSSLIKSRLGEPSQCFHAILSRLFSQYQLYIIILFTEMTDLVPVFKEYTESL